MHRTTAYQIVAGGKTAHRLDADGGGKLAQVGQCIALLNSI